MRSATASAPTRIARVAMPEPPYSSLSSITTRGAEARFGDVEFSYRRITRGYKRAFRARGEAESVRAVRAARIARLEQLDDVEEPARRRRRRRADRDREHRDAF